MLTERSTSSSTALPGVGQLTRLQYVLTVSARLKNTPTCLLIYLVLILLNVIVIAYEYNGGSTRHWLAILLETVINLVLVAEVATSILHQRSDYLRHTINVVDLVLTVLCLLFFVLFLINPPSATDERYEEIDMAILIVRYGFQLTRISVLIYRGRKTTHVLTQDDIDFTVHEMRDRIDAVLSETAAASKSSTAPPPLHSGSHSSKSQSALEKQQLLRAAGEDDSSVSSEDDWRKRDRHEQALAGIELELKRHPPRDEDGDAAASSDKRTRAKAAGRIGAAVGAVGPVKRSVSPGSKDGNGSGSERRRGISASISDLSLSRSARRVEEEDEEEDEEEEDALVEDDAV